MKVKDCMCNDVCCANPATTVNEIAKMMCDNHIGCVPVCDENNCICGIVTDRDIILRTLACNKNSNTTQASEIMSCNVCTCKQEDEVSNAQSKMANNQIRRLPVCDNNNHVVGILTLGNLAQNEDEIGKKQVSTTIEDIYKCKGQQKNAE